MTTWTDEELRAVADARELLRRYLFDHLGDECADCRQPEPLRPLPARFLTDDELVAGVPVGVCASCAERRALNPPA
jgi:hypothetical protein